jgi:hypothetical protein
VPGGLAVVLLSSRFAGLVSQVGAWPLAAGGLVLEAVGYLWFELAIGEVDPVVGRSRHRSLAQHGPRRRTLARR